MPASLVGTVLWMSMRRVWVPDPAVRSETGVKECAAVLARPVVTRSIAFPPEVVEILNCPDCALTT